MTYRLIHYPGGRILHNQDQAGSNCSLPSLVTSENYTDYDSIDEVPKPYLKCEKCMQ